MKQSIFVIAFCLFLTAALPRLFTLDAHWSSDETLWLDRSARFISAIKHGEFSKTLITHHPGVMTMWLAGLRQFFGENAVTVSLKDLALARWFIGVAVSAGLVSAFFLLRRMFSFLPALAIWAFLAINPFLIAQSRRVHTDALATLFILLTVLLFLCYCIDPKRRSHLILSGVTFGLACLSKSYSFILLPWIPICLFLFRHRQHHHQQFFFFAILSILLFLNCSLITVLGLLPIFWTPLFAGLTLCLFGLTCLIIIQKNPRVQVGQICVAFAGLAVICFFVFRAVWSVFSGIEWAVTTAHGIEHFFLGKIVNDPGWLFYPFVILLNTTPFTIPFAIIGFIYLWKQREKTQELNQQFRIAFSILCCILLFIFCLSLTAKKFSRYLLPAFPMLDILAGFGAFYSVKWVGKQVKIGRSRQVTHIACILLVFALTVAPVFALHPYYGTYYNPCWKVTDITKLITVGEASGLDLAAKYLNEKANASQMPVQVSPLGSEFFQYYFNGPVYSVHENQNKETQHPSHFDYEVVYIRDSQIKRVPQTGIHNGKLEHTIVLNGIPQVWIYQLSQEVEE